MVQTKKEKVQQIAVFGESGSGKTVLVSSFYGATQEPKHAHSELYNVVADNPSDGIRLHKNYLGLKESQVPMGNRFKATSYAFNVKVKTSDSAKPEPINALKLVWHDYPGEWFEASTRDAEEERRRVETFRNLLGSDVALLLVDGQKLLDNAGEEERYLKSLFTVFHNGLLALKDDILDQGKPLVDFPRIWIVALSKADLLPEMDVQAFRDLVILKGGDELIRFRGLVEDFIEGDEALSVGEDFLVLSSAKFEVGKIEVSKRIGVDLVLPLASILPFERHVQWAEKFELPNKVLENILNGTDVVAAILAGTAFLAKLLPPRFSKIIKAVGPTLAVIVQQGGKQLRDAHQAALEKKKFMAATLTAFKIDLEEAEEKSKTLLRSKA